ncbi:MAG: 30S ribosomal protein S12 methylthiotransferase RimO, partial [Sphaerochaetaceae bacterium]
MSNTRDQKRLYIEHLGCAKNQVDAEVMLNVLAGEGYTSVEDASDADLILVNTCGFIESARKESIDTFFALKNAYPEAKIILTGCLSQRYAKELSDELIEADAIFGNRDLQEIAQVVREVNRGKRVVLTPS